MASSFAPIDFSQNEWKDLWFSGSFFEFFVRQQIKIQRPHGIWLVMQLYVWLYADAYRCRWSLSLPSRIGIPHILNGMFNWLLSEFAESHHFDFSSLTMSTRMSTNRRQLIDLKISPRILRFLKIFLLFLTVWTSDSEEIHKLWIKKYRRLTFSDDHCWFRTFEIRLGRTWSIIEQE